MGTLQGGSREQLVARAERQVPYVVAPRDGAAAGTARRVAVARMTLAEERVVLERRPGVRDDADGESAADGRGE